MNVGMTFYLSRVIGKKVCASSGEPIAKLMDIIVNLDAIRPKIIALKIKRQGKVRIVDFCHFSITKHNNQYVIVAEKLEDVEIFQIHTLFLVKHVLDKQIVDVDGRKVVRVNDLRLVVLKDGTYTVAVDVGFEGFLRRLGIAKPIKKVLKSFQINIPSNLLLWDEVEAIDFTNRGIRLSKTYTKLSLMHPSDLADILEDLDRSSQLAIFASLDEEKAVDVLEELETDVQVNVIENLPLEKAVDMLQKMPVDEVADILEELEEQRANEILNEMEKEVSDEVRELMGYSEYSVGSIMNKDLVSFLDTTIVSDAIRQIKQEKPESDTIYSLYIVNSEEKMVGYISLYDLILAEPHVMLHTIMNREIVSVYDDDQIEDLPGLVTKYNLLAIPVVDHNHVLNGIVTINDVLYELTRSKRRK